MRFLGTGWRRPPGIRCIGDDNLSVGCAHRRINSPSGGEGLSAASTGTMPGGQRVVAILIGLSADCVWSEQSITNCECAGLAETHRFGSS